MAGFSLESVKQMRRRSGLTVRPFVALLSLLAGMGGAAAQVSSQVSSQVSTFDPSKLVVCADPSNLPFSNARGEGFENKLAELIASKLDVPLTYAWFPEESGLVLNTMENANCNLVMGYARRTGLIEDTNPYYYTSYVLLYRKGDESLAGVENLSDERLADKKIGVFARTPPISMMALNDLRGNAKIFSPVSGSDGENPAVEMIDEVASGALDAGILWGPLGGYYATKSAVPLALVPLVKEKVGPLTVYGITMGIRPKEPEWEHTLNKLIAENEADINAILLDYNVPVLDQSGTPIKAATAER